MDASADSADADTAGTIYFPSSTAALDSHDYSGSDDPDDVLLSQKVVPPALYLPTTGASSTYGAEILLHQAADGRTALLAYTALDRLARCMGPHQPWVLYPTERLGDLDATQPYQVIYLDQQLPRDMWRRPGHQQQPAQQAQPSPPTQTGWPAQTTQAGWPAQTGQTGWPTQQTQPSPPTQTGWPTQPGQPAQQTQPAQAQPPRPAGQPAWPTPPAPWQEAAR